MAIVSYASQTVLHRKQAQWYRHYGKSKFAPSLMASSFCWSSPSGLVWQKPMMPPALCSLGFCPFAGQICLTSGHADTKTDCCKITHKKSWNPHKGFQFFYFSSLMSRPVQQSNRRLPCSNNSLEISFCPFSSFVIDKISFSIPSANCSKSVLFFP